MPENASFSGSIDQLNLDFVEREATPRLLVKLSIQLRSKISSDGSRESLDCVDFWGYRFDDLRSCSGAI
jgi:hypothetical protein